MLLTRPESRKFGSPNFTAYISWLKKLPIGDAALAVVRRGASALVAGRVGRAEVELDVLRVRRSPCRRSSSRGSARRSRPAVLEAAGARSPARPGRVGPAPSAHCVVVVVVADRDLVVLGALVGVRRDDAVAVRVDGVQVGPVLVAGGRCRSGRARGRRAPAPGRCRRSGSGRRRARRRRSSRRAPAGSARRSGAPAAGRPAGSTTSWRRARRACSATRRVGELLDLDVRADVVRRARGVDVGLDVRRLLVRLGGLDLELLHDAGPDQAEQDRRDREQRQTDRRQQPGAAPDVDEEQDRADHRDAEQDVLGRQHRVVGRCSSCR